MKYCLWLLSLFLLPSCLSTSAFHEGNNPWPKVGEIYIESAVTQGNEVTFTLKNRGEKEIPLLYAESLPLPPFHEFKGVHYPGTGGTCGTVLPLASECTLVLEKNFPAVLAMMDKAESVAGEVQNKSRDFWNSVRGADLPAATETPKP